MQNFLAVVLGGADHPPDEKAPDGGLAVEQPGGLSAGRRSDSAGAKLFEIVVVYM